MYCNYLEGGMDSSTATVLIYLMSGTGFIATLLGMVAVFSIARQLNNLQVYYTTRATAAAFAKPVPLIESSLVPKKTRDIPRVRLSPTIPREWQIPVQEGTPDQVVIIIEPDKEPTRQEATVMRLIDYLKKWKSAAG
jgi:hypothetical protein